MGGCFSLVDGCVLTWGMMLSMINDNQCSVHVMDTILFLGDIFFILPYVQKYTWITIYVLCVNSVIRMGFLMDSLLKFKLCSKDYRIHEV